MLSQDSSTKKRVSLATPPEGNLRLGQACEERPNNCRKPRVAIRKQSELNKSNPRKMLVRHPEYDLPANKQVVKLGINPQGTEEVFNTRTGQETKNEFKARYAVPELYSTLCVAKEIQDIKSSEQMPLKIGNMPAEVKQNLIEKASFRLNFQPEEQLYRDLVSLNVDATALHNATSAPALLPRIASSTRRFREREPQLADFYQPGFTSESCVVPEPSLSTIGKVRSYSGFSVYKRKLTWERPDKF